MTVNEKGLEPCACGGAAALYYPDPKSETRFAANIVCHHCGVSMQMADHDSNPARVIAAWNRRHPSTGVEGGVKVKGLEWKSVSDASTADTYGCRFIAHCSFGEYFVNSGAYGKRGWSYSRLGYAEIEAASADEAKALAEADYDRRILTAIEPVAASPGVPDGDEADEAYELGKRDGYDEAVQEIDVATGGDGEYRYCTDHDPERHCPDATTMKARIIDRFAARAHTAPQAANSLSALVRELNWFDPAFPARYEAKELAAHRERIKAALSIAPINPTHRHKKRGSEYVLIGLGKMQAEGWLDGDSPTDDNGNFPLIDMREITIYRSVDDGSLWVRPREEFEDGRFEDLRALQRGKE